MSGDAWVPSACTLPTAEQPLRVAEFDDLFRAALRTVDRPDPNRLVLTLATAPGRADAVRDLTNRESACCSFFTFTLTEHVDLLRLEVTVPTAQVDVLDEIAKRAQRVRGFPT